ncbi:MAG: hypothetical protein COV60_01615 [Candidatus Magasanikbacteria bacterium CG11_big_fil_rev_8_21_14_0_20_43_7]|uniref:Uncharacterized protein n=1 Tax=Candidatus Magasanikbacteria bacterium CG11_big_fil_rev_8_21_14_0_20_43_7 TaxID=1974654 RepID=A0A2H0N2Q6_9BACT|nr:MAG: hypothetical protein COV60_01615 [Candidatus Magasanikbacteria bacterium CG11_big_fil_rev_8_21_14_0_20_43_7]
MTHDSRTSIFFLISANAVPLVGVLFFGWSLFGVLFFYWLETVVVGILNVPKMYMTKGVDTQMTEGLNKLSESARARAYTAIRTFTIPFFVFHFGMFALVHGIFVFSLYGPADITFGSVITALVTSFVSHGYSFVTNFIGKKEYLTRSINQQMGQPYKRVVILHLAILFGAFPLMVFGSPFVAVLILIVLKTCFDMYLHMREHASSVT